MTYILASDYYNWPDHKLFLPFLIVAISYLMVSNIPYTSMKGINLGMRESFGLLVIAVLGIYILVLYMHGLIFLGALLYVFSGPVVALYELRKGYFARQAQEAAKRHAIR